MRLIDADALIERLQKDPLYPLVERYNIYGVIDSSPTFNVKGTQIGAKIKFNNDYICGVCGDFLDWTDGENVSSRYCPCCGSRLYSIDYILDTVNKFEYKGYGAEVISSKEEHEDARIRCRVVGTPGLDWYYAFSGSFDLDDLEKKFKNAVDTWLKRFNGEPVKYVDF